MAGTLLVTGSSGLIGSAAVRHFAALGWDVVGVDNNFRAELLGAEGDTTPVLRRLTSDVPGFRCHALDVRDRAAILALVTMLRPQAVIHCAAQPAHDLGAKRPFDDFDVNAVGTLNLLEALRTVCPASPFVYLSTNKVYGDAVNEIPLVERDTRYEYADPAYEGVDEFCRIDASMHTLMGASKLAGDLLVQEYGRTFGLPTVSLRCGCLTGSAHAGTEQHGFLAYLVRAVIEGRRYRIFGYGGKQVRDNLHARDVCRAIECFLADPDCAAVYNLGGGRPNSVSVLEAIVRCEERVERPLETQILPEPRRGDHCCYVSDCRRFRQRYPAWSVTQSLDDIFDDLFANGRTSPSREDAALSRSR